MTLTRRAVLSAAAESCTAIASLVDPGASTLPGRSVASVVRSRRAGNFTKHAAGGELVPYLCLGRFARLPHAARRAGPLDSDGRKRLGRPDRAPRGSSRGEPIWPFIGPLLDADSQDPRYLGWACWCEAFCSGGTTLIAIAAAPVWSKVCSICWRYASGTPSAPRFVARTRRPTTPLSLAPAGTACCGCGSRR